MTPELLVLHALMGVYVKVSRAGEECAPSNAPHVVNPISGQFIKAHGNILSEHGSTAHLSQPESEGQCTQESAGSCREEMVPASPSHPSCYFWVCGQNVTVTK